MRRRRRDLPPTSIRALGRPRRTERSDGLSGTSTTTIKRDVGDGLSVGGQIKTPYQEPAIGGSGPPANPVDGARSGNVILGPVLEKKF